MPFNQLTERNVESLAHLYCPGCRRPIGARSSSHQIQLETPGGYITIGASYAVFTCGNCGNVSETKQAVRTGRLYLVSLGRLRWPARTGYGCGNGRR